MADFTLLVFLDASLGIAIDTGERLVELLRLGHGVRGRQPVSLQLGHAQRLQVPLLGSGPQSGQALDIVVLAKNVSITICSDNMEYLFNV